MKDSFICEVCGAEYDYTLSKITISGAYGTFFDNEYLELDLCPKCSEDIINYIISIAERGEGLY